MLGGPADLGRTYRARYHAAHPVVGIERKALWRVEVIWAR
jgi:hypothetical protein